MTDETWTDEYIELLLAVPQTPALSRAAQALKTANLPPAIYRYRPATEYAFKNLEDGTEWLTRPFDYNDPYDSLASIALRAELADGVFSDIVAEGLKRQALTEDDVVTAREHKRPVEEIIRRVLRFDPDITDEAEERRKVAAAFADTIQKRGSEMENEISTRLQALYLVCSLSERADSILMWSHYADHHRGFLVEYATDDLATIDGMQAELHPVQYSSERYGMSGLFGTGAPQLTRQHLLAASLRKADEWLYEREWRLSRLAGPGAEGRATAFPIPVRVTLGARSSYETRTRVCAIAAKRGFEVRRAELSDRFSLRYVATAVEAGADAHSS